MPQAVTVYRWDDPGAPQMGSGNLWPGILNILKKCLVEGYGTKSAAGWTVEYEDVPGNKCVFRNDPVQGSGGYVQFQRQADQIVYLKSALHMAAIDNYVNDGYLSSINMSTVFNNGKWLLFATPTAFYIFFAAAAEATYSGNNNHRSAFVGDFISTVKNDPSTFVTIAFQVESKTPAAGGQSATAQDANQSQIENCFTNTTFYNSSSAQTYCRILLPLNTDGSPNTVNHVFTTINETSAFGRRSQARVDPVHLDRCYLVRISSSVFDIPSQPPIRGYLPGLFTTGLPANYLVSYPMFDSFYFHLWYARNNTSAQGGTFRVLNYLEWESPNRD